MKSVFCVLEVYAETDEVIDVDIVDFAMVYVNVDD
jgi:hypothetical protein